MLCLTKYCVLPCLSFDYLKRTDTGERKKSTLSAASALPCYKSVTQ